MDATNNFPGQEATGKIKELSDHDTPKAKKLSYTLKQKYTERWTYFFYFIFLGLVLTSLALNNKRKTEENLLPHHALAMVSSGIQKTSNSAVIPIDVPLKENIKTIKTIIPPVKISPIILPDDLNKDSIRTLDTQVHKSKKTASVRRGAIQQKEIRIPCYADNESLKICQNKLLESGIRLDITGIVYGTKDKNGVEINNNVITYCNADIYVGDSLYKSVELNDFKEFRVKWDSYGTGEVSIKSISMLDSNNMLRKF